MKLFAVSVLSLFLNFASYSQTEIPEVTSPSSKIRIGFCSGIGYMTGSAKEAKRQLSSLGFKDSDANKYYNDLKVSFPVSASIHYFLNPSLGLGFNSNFFATGSSLKDIVEIGDGIHRANWKMEEQMYLTFLGASIMFQEKYGHNKKIGLTGVYGLGVVLYRNEVIALNYPVLITGNNIGMTGELGIEYFLNQHVALGADFSYLRCAITKINVDNGHTVESRELENEDSENISRVSFSAGLKFYF